MAKATTEILNASQQLFVVMVCSDDKDPLETKKAFLEMQNNCVIEMVNFEPSVSRKHPLK